MPGVGPIPRAPGLECLDNLLATPSLRLIPKGEKTDTFTVLAVAPFEGRTLKG